MIEGPAGHIRELWIYPVKGCRGTALQTSGVTQSGLQNDRRWMIVDDRGRFLTQREEPRLALIVPRLEADALHLALNGKEEIALPVSDQGERLSVRVWRDEVDALAPDAAGDRTLSRWLDRPVRIVRFPDDTVRACDPAYAPANSHTAFADGFPVLVTNDASLAELNAALAARGATPVPMTRFRPNIVIAGFPAGTEDKSSELVVEDKIRLSLVKRCDRCVVTTVDQETAQRGGREPLATLLRTRRNDRTGGAWFGQNAVPLLVRTEHMTLRVGDGCALCTA